MKQGDIVSVSGFTTAFADFSIPTDGADKESINVFDVSKEIGIIIEVFDTDNAAWVFFPSVGKVYINLNSLKKIT